MDAVDISVFIVVLGVYGAIGIYYGCKDRKNASVNSYFFGSNSVNSVAVGLSLMVTYSSAIGFVSQPAESYIVGTEFIWSAVSRFFTVIPATIYFVPAFRRLNMKSSYEFVEMRFNRPLRKITASFGTLSMVVYPGLVVYITAATLNVVAEIPTNWSIAITTIFCIFYTSLGGMKAVIWTDAAQFVFMIAGLLAIFIRGVLKIGGFESFSVAMERGERYTMFRFDYGIISRVSPWGRAFGTIGSYTYYLISQQSVQRYQSCKTTSQARWASSFNMFFGGLITLGLAGIGLVCFAIFETCDPVRSGTIQSVDQIVPYAAVYLLDDISGLIGLYVAALCSATLSTVSSSINSLAIVVVEEFLCPLWGRLRTSESLKLSAGKITVVFIGIIVLGIAYFASLSRSNVLQLFVSVTGLINGPFAGLYLLGFFCPKANSRGGTAGFVLSVAFGLFLFIGNEFFKIPYQSNVPPTFTYGCPVDNSTTTIFTTVAVTEHAMTSTEMKEARSALQDLLNMHYNMPPLIGMLLTYIMGYLISLVTGPSDPSECDPKLFIPLVDNKCLPKSVITFFRFGVPREDERDGKEKSAPLPIILEEKL